MKINIPEVLTHLRARVVDAKRDRRVPTAEQAAMTAAAWVLGDARRRGLAQRAARVGAGPLTRRGRISWLPGPFGGWSSARDTPALPPESFREWWRRTRGPGR